MTQPTCTETGFTTHTCSACGDRYADGETTALGHRWDGGSVTREPTEQNEGENTYTCTVCGKTRTETIPMLEHVHRYASVVTAPTYTDRGFTTHTCSGCGHSYADAWTDPLPARSGDFNLDGTVNDADVAYLLWHTLFPEKYPIIPTGDLNGDGAVTDLDVAYLLWHTLFPEHYPL